MRDISDTMTLSEIDKNVRERNLELPSVQRGFVWKPYQIEDLWDSVLRGYPIGAIVISDKKNKNLLLDGQQRLTALCLGLANLNDKNNFFRSSLYSHRIFIDLKKPRPDDIRKFYIRVTTRSHPWGYQKTNNTKPLSAENIRKWLVSNKINNPLDENILGTTLPYDAILPIPLNIFTSKILSSNIISKNEIKDDISNWLKKHMLLEKYNDFEKNDKEEKYTISDIYTFVYTAIEKVRIPVLKLNDNDKILYSDYIAQIQDEDSEEDNQKSDIENMFVRLNAAGTPINGEELNYSLLKSSLLKYANTDKIRKIEESCNGIMRPARFITMAFRLWQNTKNNKNQNNQNTSQSLQMRINTRQFERTINSNQRENFHEFLNNLIENKLYKGQTILEYIQSLLLYGNGKRDMYNTKDYRLPFPLFIKISESAPEVMFLLIYRIYTKDGYVKDENIHRSLLSIILYLFWLGKDERGRHNKVLSKIWPIVQLNLDSAVFWSYLLIECAGDTVHSYPPKKIKFNLNNLDARRKNFYKFFGDDEDVKFDNYAQWYNILLYDKDLLLYAQRHFISAWYNKEEFMLDDTNTPFDWDHIAADSLQRKKQNISPLLKEIYQTNGNFRAWPYELNRADQDSSPHEKFCFTDDIEKYRNMKDILDDKYFSQVNSPKNMEKYIAEFSFYCHDWINCKVKILDMIKYPDNWKELFRLILRRIEKLDLELRKNIFDKIYKNDYQDMLIDKRKWENSEKNVYYLKKSVGSDVYFYFSTNENNLIEEFGLFSENKEGLSNIISQDWQQKIETFKNVHYLYTNEYNLATHHPNAYKKIINEISIWIKKVLQKNYYNNLLENIKNAFKL